MIRTIWIKMVTKNNTKRPKLRSICYMLFNANIYVKHNLLMWKRILEAFRTWAKEKQTKYKVWGKKTVYQIIIPSNLTNTFNIGMQILDSRIVHRTARRHSRRSRRYWQANHIWSWSIVLYGQDTWMLLKAEVNYLQSF